MSQIFAVLVVTIGAFLQSSFGYGMGVFAVPILLLLDPAWIPGPLLTSGILLTTLISRREFKSLEITDLKFSLPAYFIGAIVASTLLSSLSDDGISFVSGGIVILGVLISISSITIIKNKLLLMVSGIFSGIMSTLTSAGGAPIAIVYQNETGSKVRSTLSVFFTIGSTVSLFILAIFGHYTWDEFTKSLLLFPGVIAGFILSRYSINRINEKMLRRGILSISFFAGIMIIFQASI